MSGADVAISAHLRIRRYARADLASLTALLTDPVTMQHWPATPTADDARAWLERALAADASCGHGRCAIESIETGEYVGDAGIVEALVDGRRENDLGYIVSHRFWRRGYGLEAARACLDYGRAMGMRRIVANMATDNVGSVRVAERLGLVLEKRFVNPRNRGKETFLYAWNATESDR